MDLSPLTPGFELPKLSTIDPVFFLLCFTQQVQMLSYLASLGISFLNKCDFKVNVLAFGLGFTYILGY